MNTRTVAAIMPSPADPDVSAIIAATRGDRRTLKPRDHFTEIADELHRAADAVASLAGSGLPKPRHFNLNIQPGDRGSDDEGTVASVDAMAQALLGINGHPHEVGRGMYHYGTDQTWRGPISATIYQGISAEYAQRIEHDRVLAEREAELEKLRAELEELRRSRTHPKWDTEYAGRGVDEEETGDPVPAGVEGVSVGAGAIRQVSAPPATGGPA